jgi:hypothetical protein
MSFARRLNLGGLQSNGSASYPVEQSTYKAEHVSPRIAGKKGIKKAARAYLAALRGFGCQLLSVARERKVALHPHDGRGISILTKLQETKSQLRGRHGGKRARRRPRFLVSCRFSQVDGWRSGALS